MNYSNPVDWRVSPSQSRHHWATQPPSTGVSRYHNHDTTELLNPRRLACLAITITKLLNYWTPVDWRVSPPQSRHYWTTQPPSTGVSRQHNHDTTELLNSRRLVCLANTITKLLNYWTPVDWRVSPSQSRHYCTTQPPSTGVSRRHNHDTTELLNPRRLACLANTITPPLNYSTPVDWWVSPTQSRHYWTTQPPSTGVSHHHNHATTELLNPRRLACLANTITTLLNYSIPVDWCVSPSQSRHYWTTQPPSTGVSRQHNHDLTELLYPRRLACLAITITTLLNYSTPVDWRASPSQSRHYWTTQPPSTGVSRHHNHATTELLNPRRLACLAITITTLLNYSTPVDWRVSPSQSRHYWTTQPPSTGVSCHHNHDTTELLNPRRLACLAITITPLLNYSTPVDWRVSPSQSRHHWTTQPPSTGVSCHHNHATTELLNPRRLACLAITITTLLNYSTPVDWRVSPSQSRHYWTTQPPSTGVSCHHNHDTTELLNPRRLACLAITITTLLNYSTPVDWRVSPSQSRHYWTTQPPSTGVSCHHNHDILNYSTPVDWRVSPSQSRHYWTTQPPSTGVSLAITITTLMNYSNPVDWRVSPSQSRHHWATQPPSTGVSRYHNHDTTELLNPRRLACLAITITKLLNYWTPVDWRVSPPQSRHYWTTQPPSTGVSRQHNHDTTELLNSRRLVCLANTITKLLNYWTPVDWRVSPSQSRHYCTTQPPSTGVSRRHNHDTTELLNPRRLACLANTITPPLNYSTPVDWRVSRHHNHDTNELLKPRRLACLTITITTPLSYSTPVDWRVSLSQSRHYRTTQPPSTGVSRHHNHETTELLNPRRLTCLATTITTLLNYSTPVDWRVSPTQSRHHWTTQLPSIGVSRQHNHETTELLNPRRLACLAITITTLLYYSTPVDWRVSPSQSRHHWTTQPPSTGVSRQHNHATTELLNPRRLVSLANTITTLLNYSTPVDWCLSPSQSRHYWTTQPPSTGVSRQHNHDLTELLYPRRLACLAITITTLLNYSTPVDWRVSPSQSRHYWTTQPPSTGVSRHHNHDTTELLNPRRLACLAITITTLLNYSTPVDWRVLPSQSRHHWTTQPPSTGVSCHHNHATTELLNPRRLACLAITITTLLNYSTPVDWRVSPSQSRHYWTTQPPSTDVSLHHNHDTTELLNPRRQACLAITITTLLNYSTPVDRRVSPSQSRHYWTTQPPSTGVSRHHNHDTTELVNPVDWRVSPSQSRHHWTTQPPPTDVSRQHNHDTTELVNPVDWRVSPSQSRHHWTTQPPPTDVSRQHNHDTTELRNPRRLACLAITITTPLNYLTPVDWRVSPSQSRHHWTTQPPSTGVSHHHNHDTTELLNPRRLACLAITIRTLLNYSTPVDWRVSPSQSRHHWTTQPPSTGVSRQHNHATTELLNPRRLVSLANTITTLLNYSTPVDWCVSPSQSRHYWTTQPPSTGVSRQHNHDLTELLYPRRLACLAITITTLLNYSTPVDWRASPSQSRHYWTTQPPSTGVSRHHNHATTELLNPRRLACLAITITTLLNYSTPVDWRVLPSQSRHHWTTQPPSTGVSCHHNHATTELLNPRRLACLAITITTLLNYSTPVDWRVSPSQSRHYWTTQPPSTGVSCHHNHDTTELLNPRRLACLAITITTLLNYSTPVDWRVSPSQSRHYWTTQPPSTGVSCHHNHDILNYSTPVDWRVSPSQSRHYWTTQPPSTGVSLAITITTLMNYSNPVDWRVSPSQSRHHWATQPPSTGVSRYHNHDTTELLNPRRLACLAITITKLLNYWTPVDWRVSPPQSRHYWTTQPPSTGVSRQHNHDTTELLNSRRLVCLANTITKLLNYWTPVDWRVSPSQSRHYCTTQPPSTGVSRQHNHATTELLNPRRLVSLANTITTLLNYSTPVDWCVSPSQSRHYWTTQPPSTGVSRQHNHDLTELLYPRRLACLAITITTLLNYSTPVDWRASPSQSRHYWTTQPPSTGVSRHHNHATTELLNPRRLACLAITITTLLNYSTPVDWRVLPSQSRHHWTTQPPSTGVSCHHNHATTELLNPRRLACLAITITTLLNYSTPVDWRVSPSQSRHYWTTQPPSTGVSCHHNHDTTELLNPRRLACLAITITTLLNYSTPVDWRVSPSQSRHYWTTQPPSTGVSCHHNHDILNYSTPVDWRVSPSQSRHYWTTQPPSTGVSLAITITTLMNYSNPVDWRVSPSQSRHHWATQPPSTGVSRYHNHDTTELLNPRRLACLAITITKLLNYWTPVDWRVSPPQSRHYWTTQPPSTGVSRQHNHDTTELLNSRRLVCLANTITKLLNYWTPVDWRVSPSQSRHYCTTQPPSTGVSRRHNHDTTELLNPRRLACLANTITPPLNYSTPVDWWVSPTQSRHYWTTQPPSTGVSHHHNHATTELLNPRRLACLANTITTLLNYSIPVDWRVSLSQSRHYWTTQPPSTGVPRHHNHDTTELLNPRRLACLAITITPLLNYSTPVDWRVSPSQSRHYWTTQPPSTGVSRHHNHDTTELLNPRRLACLAITITTPLNYSTPVDWRVLPSQSRHYWTTQPPSTGVSRHHNHDTTELLNPRRLACLAITITTLLNYSTPVDWRVLPSQSRHHWTTQPPSTGVSCHHNHDTTELLNPRRLACLAITITPLLNYSTPVDWRVSPSQSLHYWTTQPPLNGDTYACMYGRSKHWILGWCVWW